MSDSTSNQEIFTALLEDRISQKRRSVRDFVQLSNITSDFLLIMARENFPKEIQLKKILDNPVSGSNTPAIDQIIDDCEIYYNMSSCKAFDAFVELSALATFYLEDTKRYKRICSLIKSIRASYPMSS